MTKGRTYGTIAALWCGCAALAMLTGVAGARADELQINQQALDARIDQLAATGQNAGTSRPFSIDQNKVAEQPVVAGSFPRSILIPGTDTSIKVYGQVTEILDYWLSGGNPNTSPQSTTVGDNGQLQAVPLNAGGGNAEDVNKARSNGIYWETPKESKIGFETRTPTPLGEARTVIEFDWAGSNGAVPGGSGPTAIADNLVPRLRYAYGTLGGLLAGQATSNFSDPDANAETIDFGGNVGEPGKVRVPQIRWTMPTYWGSSFSVSAETAETQLATAAGIEASDAGSPVTSPNIAKGTAPTFTAALYFPEPWGHLDFSTVLLPGIDLTDGHFDKQFIGYGGHVGASYRPGWFGWARDTFSAHFTAGEAIGTYLNSSSNFQVSTNYETGLAPGSINTKPTDNMGAMLGYQHWWTHNLRSNINGGFQSQYNIPIAFVGKKQAGSINKELMSAHANIIWNPVSFVDVGFEYTWGQRTVLDNRTGTQNVFIGKFGFRF